ncbi:MAG: PKD domain-containing protein, partial [Thermoplasmatota archaeon]
MRKVWPVLLFVLLALSGCATNSEQKPEPQTTIEPEVDFTWTPEKPFVGDLVSFAPSGSKAAGTDIVEWFWDFGDGATATIATPTHAFSTPGAFEVAAKMRLSDGQTAEYEQIVPVAAKNAPSSSSSSSGTPSSTTSSSSPGLGFPVI